MYHPASRASVCSATGVNNNQFDTQVEVFLRYCFVYDDTFGIVALLSLYTTLQSLMNTKLSLHRFWPCHENGLMKTIQMIPHNLCVSFKLTFLYYGLRLILVYPNPQ